MKASVQRAPVTVKIRLGWNDEDRNYLDQARAAVDGGADAITVHGRTRNARYRLAADWDAIGEVAAAVPVPVVGNGDLLFPHEISAALARSGCAGVMVARGALIKPWIFREAVEGYRQIDGEARLGVYRRYVALAREHWGEDDAALLRIREFLRWHVGSGAATSRNGRMAAGRRCRSASRPLTRKRPWSNCWRGTTKPPWNTSLTGCCMGESSSRTQSPLPQRTTPRTT